MTLFSRLKDFWADRSGTLTVEALFIVPVMALGMSGFFAFWHIYQTQNMVQKGTYAVADMLSREMIPATPAFINGLETTLEYMIQRNANIRVTSIRRTSDGPTGVTGLDVLWSYSPGNILQARTEADLWQIEPDIPMMSIGSNVIIFESRVPYTSVTDMVTVTTINETLAMRPRFLPTLCMTGVVC